VNAIYNTGYTYTPQSIAAVKAELDRVDKARAAIPPVETMLGIEEIEVNSTTSA
jgi:hypothetical protein